MPSADPVFFELKYCERCGGLWLRPHGGESIYCSSCSRLMRELPPRRGPASGTPPPSVILSEVEAFSGRERSEGGSSLPKSRGEAEGTRVHTASESKDPYSRRGCQGCAGASEIGRLEVRP